MHISTNTCMYTCIISTTSYIHKFMWTCQFHGTCLLTSYFDQKLAVRSPCFQEEEEEEVSEVATEPPTPR